MREDGGGVRGRGISALEVDDCKSRLAKKVGSPSCQVVESVVLKQSLRQWGT